MFEKDLDFNGATLFPTWNRRLVVNLVSESSVTIKRGRSRGEAFVWFAWAKIHSWEGKRQETSTTITPLTFALTLWQREAHATILHYFFFSFRATSSFLPFWTAIFRKRTIVTRFINIAHRLFYLSWIP